VITEDLLERVQLFAQLPEGERTSLASKAADVQLERDEWLLQEGQSPAFFAVLEGELAVYKSVGGQDQHIQTYRTGEYFGEVPLLLGSQAIASVRALTPSRVMRLEPDDFRDLIASCKTLNTEVLRTMARRVERLQQITAESPPIAATVIGHLDTTCHDLRDFLTRNRVAFVWRDLDDEEAVARLEADGILRQSSNGASAEERLGASSLPVMIVNGGPRLEGPSFRQAAEALGLQTEPQHDLYDIVIVGGGPAGLAAAVYGASEGLCTLLVERMACGGQAGTSSRIENYLGFPAGLTGEELSLRARQQATRFGAELLVARTVKALELRDATAGEDGARVIVLDDGARVATDAVILATGVHWRRLDVPEIEQFAGRGVHYGAARTDALGLRGRTVHLVGGGNSAGQAAMLFSSYADSVTMLVRGPSLAESMSQYLIDNLATKSNVRIETDAEVVGVGGGDALEALEVESGGRREWRKSDALFVFIGARAETDWLPEEVMRDHWAYVCTGRDVMDLLAERSPGAWPLDRDPFLLETNVPGVFAAGDVRHGSIKRVASAVGEGSMAIAFIHRYLAEIRPAGTLARRST
jgi:thioredoxin reductase (NADPH)